MFHKDFIVSAGELQRGLLRQRSEAAIGGAFTGTHYSKRQVPFARSAAAACASTKRPYSPASWDSISSFLILCAPKPQQTISAGDPV